MELGVQVIGDYDHVRSVAHMCEQAGIAAVALADHYLYGDSPQEWAAPAYDSLVQTAALARDTSTVELVMLVSPITFRHPAVYAKTITTVDEISGGRFVFGLGTGWHDGEHEVFGFEYPPMGTRFEWLEDALAYLRTFLDDPSEGYDGVHWSLAAQEINPAARSDLRLMVGGGGPFKTPTLVGRFANEYNLYHHEPVGVEERLAVMKQAAIDAARNPGDILITTCYPMIGGVDEREIDEFFRDLADRRGVDAAELREKLGKRVTIAPWEIHRDKLGELEALGFERVYLQGVASVPWAVESALAALTS